MIKFLSHASFYLSIFLCQGVLAYQFTDAEIREMMLKVAQEYSKDLPTNLDKETIWEGVFAGNERNIIYRYKLNTITKDQDGLDFFKRLVSRKHKNNYCSTPELSIFRKEGVDIDHYFYSYKGNYLFSVKTSVRDC
tara:strand:+ start:70 stop:477 length:408 start_codon:yes stop_codon:yes gene_type:complete